MQRIVSKRAGFNFISLKKKFKFNFVRDVYFYRDSHVCSDGSVQLEVKS